VPTTLPGDRLVVGCGTTAVQRADELLVTLDGSTHTYRIGEPGDAVLLGDWDCDGTDTPGLYRPGTGLVLEFGTWQATGAGVGPTATAQLAPHRSPYVERGSGCDTIAIR
jgi:hypothetical protein